MYQLFAYGKKYGVAKVVLIYPQWQNFNQSFWFDFEDNLQLCVTPFNLENDAKTSIFAGLNSA